MNPAAIGIGWRAPHYAALIERRPPLDFIEVHSENFFAAGGAALAVLDEGRAIWPVSLHGVGLALGSAAGLDEWHLDRLARLVERVDPLRVSDHASFARAPLAPGEAVVHGADLLPVAFTEASLRIMTANVQRVQDRLRRTILVENISAYLRWADDAIAEAQFLDLLARRTGCGLLLDVNNLVVNALNAGEEPLAAVARFVGAIDPGSVGEIHLAGYADGGDIVIDDHGSRVHAPVWQAYRLAIARLGPRPTLIEWDTDVPELEVLLDEAAQAARVMAAAAQGGGMTVEPLTPPELALEARRQQALLRALWRRGDDADLAAWLREAPSRLQRGLGAYRANGAAGAARALAAAYPTVAALVGAEALDAVAAAHWQHCPPERGDLACFGAGLPEALAADAQLAQLPYLADVARLDWAVHRGAAAADHDTAPDGLALLGERDPAVLRLQLRPGTAVIASRWPIVTIWRAHHDEDAHGTEDRFAAPRAALARGEAQSAIVWRCGWRVRVEALTPVQARFTAALLASQNLSAALDAAGADFEFEPWLLQALRAGWLAAVVPTVPPDAGA